MNAYQLTLVGFPYNDVKDCLPAYYDQALGHTITLRPEPDNAIDHYAVAVYDWLHRKACYVCHNDRPIAFALLKALNLSRLRTKIVGSSPKTRGLVTRVEYDGDLPEISLSDGDRYSGWGHKIASLPMTNLLRQLITACETIEDLLAMPSRTEEDELELRASIELVAEKGIFDISLDMNIFCTKLGRCLEQMPDAWMHEMGARLLRMKSAIGGQVTAGKAVYEHWRDLLIDHTECIVELGRILDKDTRTPEAVCLLQQQIEAELFEFGDNYYQLYLQNPVLFLQTANSRDISRADLWHFVSGIIINDVLKKTPCGQRLFDSWVNTIDVKALSDDMLNEFVEVMRYLNDHYEHLYDDRIVKFEEEQQRRLKILYADKASVMNFYKGSQNVERIDHQQNVGGGDIKLLGADEESCKLIGNE